MLVAATLQTGARGASTALPTLFSLNRLVIPNNWQWTPQQLPFLFQMPACCVGWNMAVVGRLQMKKLGT
jgi:hypothetical protein